VTVMLMREQWMSETFSTLLPSFLANSNFANTRERPASTTHLFPRGVGEALMAVVNFYQVSSYSLF